MKLFMLVWIGKLRWYVYAAEKVDCQAVSLLLQFIRIVLAIIR